MIRHSRVLIVSFFFLMLSVGTGFADTVSVAGTGHCDTTDSCNGAGVGDFSNYLAQNGSLRNFFIVNLAGIGNITSASLNIWDVPAPDPQFDLYAASGLTYAGLANGSIIASGNVPLTGTPQYLSFSLNADGLAALNAARVIIDGGGNAYFTFGGDLPGVGDQAFAGSLDDNNRSFLDFTVGSVNQTPEPASLALLGSGLLGASFTWRKRFAK